MLSYALKRIVRSWRLFAALILGMMLAALFFGGVNIGADTVGRQALDQQLAATPVDLRLEPSASGFSVPTPFTNYQNLATTLKQVNGVLLSEIRGDAQDQSNYTLGRIKALSDSSLLYKHLLINGKQTPGQNETIVAANSVMAKNHKLNDLVKYSLGINTNTPYNITLKIVGFASLDTVAANTFDPNFGFFYSPQETQNIVIVSWEQTYRKILDWAYQQYAAFSRPVYGVTAYVDVYLDRDQLISPWDVEGSAARIAQIDARISNLALQNGFSSTDYVLPQLQSLAPSLFALRLSFTVFSIPVFFMAWYVGRTVSHASYNLRRREIGLLMTKGFSRTQLFRHFLVEALIVGLVSGTLGLALAYAFNPLFVQALAGSYGGTVFLSRETAIITVVFALILTFLSALSPAHQASSMDPAQALREYVYVEDVRASRKRGAIIAFSLGLYKIILLVLGINFLTLTRIGFSGGFLLFLIIIILSMLDFALTFTGPFLFLYGATQLSTGFAVRFHNTFAKISRRLIGDIATLASKSVFRNPRRVASLVFLVALIAGYSIWVIGDLASMEDYNVRQIKVRVGSDIRLTISGTSDASQVAGQLRAWNNITGVTPELESQFNISPSVSIRLKAIDPATWRQGAYYEPDWFAGDVNTLFTEMGSDNYTVILDRGVASYYNVEEGGTLSISQTPAPVSVRVIGFFGPDYSKLSSPGIVPGPVIITPGQYFYAQGWSYIPMGLVSKYSALFSTSNSILVKAAPGVSLSDLGNSLQRAVPSSFAQIAETTSQGPGAAISNGVLNVLRLGTVFAAAAACIGVGAVSYTGFKEREKETTMIAVRGLSYRQILGLLLTEVLPLVLFALILATLVGLITVRGDILAQNSQSFSPDYFSLLAPRRLIFPPSSQTTLLTIVGLLLLGVFLPAIAFARKDLSKMSRTVRFA